MFDQKGKLEQVAEATETFQTLNEDDVYEDDDEYEDWDEENDPCPQRPEEWY